MGNICNKCNRYNNHTKRYLDAYATNQYDDKYDDKYTNPILENGDVIDEHNEAYIYQNKDTIKTIKTIRTDINKIRQTVNCLDRRLIFLEQQTTELCKVITANDNRIEAEMFARISVISKDMESLLNNDKLLLEKIMDARMAPTVL
uniref:Uncharacterized protein n=1 Tax=viral metagenome TaxID=1070528 RepID=A0A6C0HKI9_9ZZZZ